MSNIDYEKELNKEQLSAVKTIDGPLRIIAGAGSEKNQDTCLSCSLDVRTWRRSSKYLTSDFYN